MTEPLTCLELHAAILGVAAYQKVRGVAAAALDGVVAHAAVPAGIVEWLPDLPAFLSGPFSPGASPPAGPDPDAASTQTASEIAVGHSSESTGQTWPQSWSLWERQIDAAGMVRWLKARYPAKTAACVAADLNVPLDTVTKWLARENLPNGRTLVLMICVYGPEFLAALLRDPPDWLDLAASEADQARLMAQLATLRAELDRREAEAPRRRWWFGGAAEGAP
ncbi:hypothetical protein [Methylobacterium frigidaeris]|uniref:Uncharacterized protein n=1 Tax=Methylobacterium frigidaeris TaxID=2038277 RepID=A0AA37M8P7_9HYPH|nr:hypothetical protein [Methylobacterium frigidaeris]PIK73298.1 hypothetical protein CS379_09200 [Methylobacterium frigidaeris]GJD66429.1 hypothetical protein MPEAHAMD_6627 [Methylobacterium frigidaeris]